VISVIPGFSFLCGFGCPPGQSDGRRSVRLWGLWGPPRAARLLSENRDVKRNVSCSLFNQESLNLWLTKIFFEKKQLIVN